MYRNKIKSFAKPSYKKKESAFVRLIRVVRVSILFANLNNAS